MKPANTPAASDETQATPFELRLRTLLADYADTLPDGASIEARVREQLTAPHTVTGDNRRRWRPARGGTGGPPRRPGAGMRAALSIGMVAALLLGFVFVLRSHVALPQTNRTGSSSRSSCQMVKTPQGDTVCHLRNVKATITVEQVYADATRTSVLLRISTPGLRIPHGNPVQYAQPYTLIPSTSYLQDAQGVRYMVSGNPYNVIYTSRNEAQGTISLAPLPDAELHGNQRLTLIVPQFSLLDRSQLSSAIVDGPWSASLQVMPHSGRTIAFDVAPVTQHGVTVQPMQLDIAPTGNPFDGYGVGERLILKISGLPSTTPQSALASFSTHINSPDGGSADYMGPSSLLFEGHLPAADDIPGIAAWATTPVGPSGTVLVEVIFLSPPLPTLTGVQTLRIDQFSLNYTQSPPIVKGPWVFHLALG